MSNFVSQYFEESIQIIRSIDGLQVENVVNALRSVRDNGGRLFLIGVGGSAGTASHAVNDFRKITNIETYSPVDNVSELTARANDEGFDTVFSDWLQTSRLNKNDAVFVLSVGGGNIEKNVSMCLVKAIDNAKTVGAKVFGIVGRDGGYTKQNADACITIPPTFQDRITPHSEGLASVLLHLLVSHPLLKSVQTKWESVK